MQKTWHSCYFSCLKKSPFHYPSSKMIFRKKTSKTVTNKIYGNQTAVKLRDEEADGRKSQRAGIFISCYSRARDLKYYYKVFFQPHNETVMCLFYILTMKY